MFLKTKRQYVVVEVVLCSAVLKLGLVLNQDRFGHEKRTTGVVLLIRLLLYKCLIFSCQNLDQSQSRSSALYSEISHSPDPLSLSPRFNRSYSAGENPRLLRRA